MGYTTNKARNEWEEEEILMIVLILSELGILCGLARVINAKSFHYDRIIWDRMIDRRLKPPKKKVTTNHGDLRESKRGRMMGN